jgi:hypothetical protein
MIDSPEFPDRARIDDTGDAIDISIPIKKDWGKINFLTLWMLGWAWGEVFVARLLLSGDELHGERNFVTLWLILWTAGGIATAVKWLWNVAGIERVRFRSDAALIRREVFGVGFSREYDASRVGKLWLTDDFQKAPAARRPADRRGGKISFDYVETTVQFGIRLDRGEAARIILKIQKRFAFTRA